MHALPDVARSRFGNWATKVQLPPGSRAAGVKAADHAYFYLKNLIVTLELPPLSIITENEVAAATGVSRTPVREALLRLQSERLLDVIPQRGAVVPAITLRAIQEQAVTRTVLEGYGIEWTCTHRVPIADRLFELIDEQAAIYDEDPERVADMVTVDKEFHWTLVKATGNTEFAHLYNSLHDRQLRIGIAMFQAVPIRRCTAIDEHREIARAIEKFDLAEARKLLEAHLVGSIPQVSGVFTD